jgi:hypothetical protein
VSIEGGAVRRETRELSDDGVRFMRSSLRRLAARTDIGVDRIPVPDGLCHLHGWGADTRPPGTLLARMLSGAMWAACSETVEGAPRGNHRGALSCR